MSWQCFAFFQPRKHPLCSAKRLYWTGRLTADTETIETAALSTNGLICKRNRCHTCRSSIFLKILQNILVELDGFCTWLRPSKVGIRILPSFRFHLLQRPTCTSRLRDPVRIRGALNTWRTHPIQITTIDHPVNKHHYNYYKHHHPKKISIRIIHHSPAMSWMARFASSMSLAHSKPQLSQHIWWINHYSSCIIIERKTQNTFKRSHTTVYIIYNIFKTWKTHIKIH